MSQPAKALGLLGLVFTLNAFGAEAVGMMPPKYLEIPDFKKCLADKDMGTYTALCMPAKRVKECPRKSWRALKKLTGDDKVPAC